MRRVSKQAALVTTRCFRETSQRLLACTRSDAGSKARFWPDFSTLEGDASALTIEREWVMEEGLGPPAALQCRSSSVDFLIETMGAAVSTHAISTQLDFWGVDVVTYCLCFQGSGRPVLQTVVEWAAAGPRSGMVFISDSDTHRGNKTRHHYTCSWGHVSVLLYVVLEDGPALIVLDSMPVDELPTPHGKALLAALVG